MTDNHPYLTFSRYLKKRFGEPVRKISVDAGFNCPNRDGSIGEGGCIFCDNRSFSMNTYHGIRPLEEQIASAINAGADKGVKKFILYFQANTNTYDSIDALKTRYDLVRAYPEIVSLAVGTRPDCVNPEVLELLNSYTDDHEVWVEYGVQTIHNPTLEYINRGHNWEDSLKAIELTRQYPQLKVCAHIILGLPIRAGKTESREMILQTAWEMGKLKIDAVKIHPLHITKDTMLADLYKQGKYTPLEQEKYIELAAEFLEYLHPDTVIQRLTADCPADLLVAPDWLPNKHQVLNGIVNRMKAEGTVQGKGWELRG